MDQLCVQKGETRGHDIEFTVDGAGCQDGPLPHRIVAAGIFSRADMAYGGAIERSRSSDLQLIIEISGFWSSFIIEASLSDQ